MQLFASYKFKDFETLSKGLQVIDRDAYTETRPTNPAQHFLNQYAQELIKCNTTLLPQKQEALKKIAKTFFDELGSSFAMYKKNFAVCLVVLSDACEPLASVSGDSRIAMAVGFKTFMQVYPILKEPGLFKFFAKEVLNNSETNLKNYNRRVAFTNGATKAGIYVLKWGVASVALTICKTYVNDYFKIIAEGLISNMVYGYEVTREGFSAIGKELDEATNKPTDQF